LASSGDTHQNNRRGRRKLTTYQAYTDGSKSDLGVGAVVVIIFDNNIIKTMLYRLNESCSNNQADQMAILKALEYMEKMEPEEKIVLVHMDSKITLQLLQNKKKHTKLIQQIRTKVQEMKQREWRVEFRRIKAHAGHRGKETADQQAKEETRNKNIEECYIKIPKSVVMLEQKVQSVKWWQREWTETTKGAITKACFSKIEDRLKFRINLTPNFTAIVTGHGNIKA